MDNNPILEKDMLDDKIGILDIKAKIDNNINCDIEMQVINKKDIEKRLLFYWSKMYDISVKEGQNYTILEKTIVILIADYELEALKEIKKYLTKWNIREEEYQQIVLTDVMELYIIELPKFKKYKKSIENTNLNSWIKFIESPEVINLEEENYEVIQARKILEDISQDERERYLAELREKYIMDQKAIEGAGYDKGLKAGFERGLQDGIKQGLHDGIKKGVARRHKKRITRWHKKRITRWHKKGITRWHKKGITR